MGGVAFYFMRAGREPAPVVPPKPVVPEATALPGVEPTPPAPEPLRLLGRVSMPARPIALAEGASQTFAIDVQGTVSRPLRYTWFLDDAPGCRTARRGAELVVRPTSTRLKEIKVVVSDGDAVKVEIRWRVKVLDTSRPPHLVAAMPTTQTLTVKSGETIGPGRGS